MKLLLLLLVAAASSQEFYQTEDDKYDTVSLSVNQLRSVIQCINDRGPCNSDIASFRKYYPDIIVEACKRCNRDHKVALCKFYRRVAKELPDELKATRLRFDPEGKYWDNFWASFSNEC